MRSPNQQRPWTSWQIACIAALVAGCGRSKSAPTCPSLPNVPHLEVNLVPALSQNGEVQIELEADGTRETCAITIEGISPAQQVGGMVRGPMTRTSTTCKGLDVRGMSSEGYLASLSIAGTPARVSLGVKRAGKLLGQGTFKPQYTPDECGFVKPLETLTLTP